MTAFLEPDPGLRFELRYLPQHLPGLPLRRESAEQKRAGLQRSLPSCRFERGIRQQYLNARCKGRAIAARCECLEFANNLITDAVARKLERLGSRHRTRSCGVSGGR